MTVLLQDAPSLLNILISQVEIMISPDIGLGMRTLRDIKVGKGKADDSYYNIGTKQNKEKVLEVPEKLMMTSQTALQGVLGTYRHYRNCLLR